jgi:hypothetical protein
VLSSPTSRQLGARSPIVVSALRRMVPLNGGLDLLMKACDTTSRRGGVGTAMIA